MKFQRAIRSLADSTKMDCHKEERYLNASWKSVAVRISVSRARGSWRLELRCLGRVVRRAAAHKADPAGGTVLQANGVDAFSAVSRIVSATAPPACPRNPGFPPRMFSCLAYPRIERLNIRF